MRYFTIRFGNSTGVHSIYESREECKKYQGDINIKRWHIDATPDQFEAGDWVEAEDGYIVQLLYIKTYTNKSNYPKMWFKFPMSSFQVYYIQRTKKYRFPRFVAYYTQQRANGFGENESVSITLQTKDMIFFAKLLIEGFDLYSAYSLAFPKFRGKSVSQKLAHIIKLLGDRRVKKAIMASIKDLQSSINRFISDEDFLEKIQAHWKHVKAGSAAELSAIKFVKDIKYPESRFGNPDDIDQLPSGEVHRQSIQEADVVKDDLPPHLLE